MSKSIDINEFIPELLPIEKSYHQQINEIKKNLIKMIVNRGFILKENEDKNIEKLIKQNNDDQEYELLIDNESNYNTTIKSKKIIIKIFDYKIASINKASPIGEFIIKNDKNYKILIVQDINQKSSNIINSYDSPTEIFKLKDLMINIVDHNLVPKHIVLTTEEGKTVMESYCAKKRDMNIIKSNDPVAKYYNMKPGEIVKIIRPSIMTCETFAYRLVIKATQLKAKT
jgi:DNA-directed RNA polymerase I, II, and III subunit RPABC1